MNGIFVQEIYQDWYQDPCLGKFSRQDSANYESQGIDRVVNPDLISPRSIFTESKTSSDQNKEIIIEEPKSDKVIQVKPEDYVIMDGIKIMMTDNAINGRKYRERKKTTDEKFLQDLDKAQKLNTQLKNDRDDLLNKIKLLKSYIISFKHPE